MNKQEAIEKIKKESWEYYDSTAPVIETKTVIEIINQIYEPKKPVVPHFVADYIDSERNSGSTLSEALGNMYYKQRIADWFYINSETFAKAWLYGYEVEKEKLYTVELPIHNGPLGFHYVLRKNKEGEIVIGSFYNKHWRNYDYCQLTEAEIKKDFEWAWKYAKEVEE